MHITGSFKVLTFSAYIILVKQRTAYCSKGHPYFGVNHSTTLEMKPINNAYNWFFQSFNLFCIYHTGRQRTVHCSKGVLIVQYLPYFGVNHSTTSEIKPLIRHITDSFKVSTFSPKTKRGDGNVCSRFEQFTEDL